MAGPEPLLVAGRYALYDEIASGGMASVHLGRLVGAAGFARVVAIKRLHRQHATNPDVVAMLMDEARLAARVRHPNVAATIDVVEERGEVLLVLEHVAGESLGALVRLARARGERVPPDVASAIVIGALAGLHAAHEARAPGGAPLEIVHRDVSPQNVLVGADGVPRVIDFGIAKANLRSSATREGELKGKLIYMPPEQLAGRDVTRAADVYAAGVVLWEVLAGRRLFDQPTHGGVVAAILAGTIPRLVDEAPWVPAGAAAVLERALAMDPAARWPTARAMADALAEVLPPAAPERVAAFVASVAGESLARRQAAVARVEAATAPRASGGAPATGGGARPAVLALAIVAVSLATGAGIAIAWVERDVEPAPPPRAAAVDPAAPAPTDAPPPDEPSDVVAEEATSGTTSGATSGGATDLEDPDPADDEADVIDLDDDPAAPSVRPRRPGARRPPRSPLPACDPPWEIDEQGIRRVKRHCLGR